MAANDAPPRDTDCPACDAVDDGPPGANTGTAFVVGLAYGIVRGPASAARLCSRHRAAFAAAMVVISAATAKKTETR